MKKKKIFLYLHLIFFYAILVTGSTYAYLNISNSSNNTVTGAVGCFDIAYEGEEIKHTNLSATTNYLEGVKSTVTLSKDVNCDIYTEAYIYIHVNDNITAPIVSVEALRYKVMQGSTEISSGFINTKGEVLLATVPLTSTSTSYNIYIWVDSSLSNKEYDNVTFTGYIYATSEQTSTVGSDKLYNIVKEGAVMDNTSSTYVSSSSGIDFTQNNSNTNGKGVYIRSGTENKAYPIYYYRGDVDNNNVIFANTCFKMVRTTDKGGIKLIYNGTPTSGTCNNTGTATQIGTKEFNTNNTSPVDVGYMYGARYTYSYTSGTGWYYAPDVTYANGAYTLTSKGSYSVETKSTIDVPNLSYHHYTCGSATATTCTSVRYVYNSLREGSSSVFYITLTNGKKVEDALSDMFDNNANTTSSTIKGNSTTSGTVDYWYYNNIDQVNDSKGNSYSTYIEDTVYCNDRSFNNYEASGWNPDGGSIRTYLYFGAYGRENNPSVACPRTVDRFTKSSSLGNGALDYPVGLLTADEARMAGGSSSENSNYYLYTSENWWLVSPGHFSLGSPNVFGDFANTNLTNIAVSIPYYGVRPVITLLNKTRISDGTGTSDDPYIIRE